MNKTTTCPRCKHENDSDLFYCELCKTLLDTDKTKNILEEDLMSLLEDEWKNEAETAPEKADVSHDKTDNEESEITANEELPEWVTRLAPSQSSSETELPPVNIEEDIAYNFPDLTAKDEDRLTDVMTDEGELPDWLQDAKSNVATAEIEPNSVPQVEEETVEPDFDDEEDDWQELLKKLPPNQDPKATLAKATLPDWLEKLEPTSESSAQIGLPKAADAVEIELVIARPRTATSPIQTFTVTPEQQKQVDLLRRLMEPKQAQEDVENGEPKSYLGRWLQPVLALLLIGIVVFGLLDQRLIFRKMPAVSGGETAVTPSSQSVRQLLDSAANQPVLIVFDYTPALAGELGGQAKTILQWVSENGSPILTTSQFASGTAVAKLATQSYNPTDLGYIPANAIGLRQLSDCMADADCSTLSTRKLDRATVKQLNDIALIIILTGDRDSLINWIEQVGSRQKIPLVAVTTQALAPVAAPYFGSNQLQTIISAQLDTGSEQPTVADSLQYTQQLAQLLIAVLFIVGGIGYSLSYAQNK